MNLYYNKSKQIIVILYNNDPHESYNNGIYLDIREIIKIVCGLHRRTRNLC